MELPSGYTKATYRRLMAAYKLEPKWGEKEDRAFVRMKGLLTSEPVLREPRFDGTNFVLTTDGCQDAFGAVLAQRFTTVLESGKSVTKLHPLAFASKRTSKTERKYKSFLLEFAALKYALDKFSDVVWGFPIEVETDCQALRDMLQIVDVRHVPGKTNVVADGLSRAAEGRPYEEGDGSEWTVKEDWEAATGLVYDVWAVGMAESGYEKRAAGGGHRAGEEQGEAQGGELHGGGWEALEIGERRRGQGEKQSGVFDEGGSGGKGGTSAQGWRALGP